jgi:ferric iron reductase protein FhuF
VRVAEESQWQPATLFADPRTVVATGLLDRPRRAWGAAPHTAAALAWKAYAWWLVNPVVLAYAEGRPLPRLDHANVEVALREERPYAEFRVLDPTPLPDTDVETRLRETLLDAHLAPVAAALVATTRIGRRTLWGSVAEAVAYPLLQRRDPGSAQGLLDGLGLADLVMFVSPGQCIRRTCCQAIAVPGLGVCDSCPVQRRLIPAAVAG